MAGLGTWFVLLMVAPHSCCGAGLYSARWALWALLLSFPLPYIANTAGWMTAELGRQPWLIYGLMRTSEGYSQNVNAGNGMFTLLGYMGLYALLGLLFTVSGVPGDCAWDRRRRDASGARGGGDEARTGAH